MVVEPRLANGNDPGMLQEFGNGRVCRGIVVDGVMGVATSSRPQDSRRQRDEIERSLRAFRGRSGDDELPDSVIDGARQNSCTIMVVAVVRQVDADIDQFEHSA
jgi:hypothetical protein